MPSIVALRRRPRTRERVHLRPHPLLLGRSGGVREKNSHAVVHASSAFTIDDKPHHIYHRLCSSVTMCCRRRGPSVTPPSIAPVALVLGGPESVRARVVLNSSSSRKETRREKSKRGVCIHRRNLWSCVLPRWQFNVNVNVVVGTLCVDSTDPFSRNCVVVAGRYLHCVDSMNPIARNCTFARAQKGPWK